jgi:hypothetical protein
MVVPWSVTTVQSCILNSHMADHYKGIRGNYCNKVYDHDPL